MEVVEPSLGERRELVLHVQTESLALHVSLGELSFELSHLGRVRGFHVFVPACVFTQRHFDVLLELLLQDQRLEVGVLARLPRVGAGV